LGVKPGLNFIASIEDLTTPAVVRRPYAVVPVPEKPQTRHPADRRYLLRGHPIRHCRSL